LKYYKFNKLTIMDTALVLITPEYLALIPLVVGITGALKLIKGFNSSYSPIVALVLGVALSALLDGGIRTIIIAGLIVGLSASGLYSGTSAIKNA
jgi:hypothetical protein